MTEKFIVRWRGYGHKGAPHLVIIGDSDPTASYLCLADRPDRTNAMFYPGDILSVNNVPVPERFLMERNIRAGVSHGVKCYPAMKIRKGLKVENFELVQVY